jgi:hypothetical protein
MTPTNGLRTANQREKSHSATALCIEFMIAIALLLVLGE